MFWVLSLATAGATVRCDVEVLDLTLPAWGESEPEAREQARLVAGIVGQYQVQGDLWSALLAEDPAALTRLSATLDAATVDDVLLAPGVQATITRCTPVKEKNAEAWSVTWPGGTPVQGRTPAIALEAARRTTCLTAFRAAAGPTLDAIAPLPPDERPAAFAAGWNPAVKALKTCYAHAPDATPVKDAAATETAATWCGRYAPGQEPGRFERISEGWGSDVYTAAEDAHQNAAYAIPVRAVGTALHAAVRASPETKLTQIASAYAQIVIAPLHPDVWLSCRAAASPSQVSWSPVEDWVQKECAASPAEFAALTRPAEGHPSRARRALCDRNLDEGQKLLASAVPVATEEMRSTLRLSGWSLQYRCGGACLAGSAAPTGTATPFPGLPDRTTRATTEQAFAAAVTARDPVAVVAILPYLDTPQAAPMLADDRFWQQMSTIVATEGWTETVTWMQHGDNWTFTPK